MYALIFLYGLIISVILGAVILVLKILGYILMAIVTSLGFSFIGLSERSIAASFPEGKEDDDIGLPPFFWLITI